MQWQPIETAPKDGTAVLLAAPGRVTCGSWLAPSDEPRIYYQDGFAPEAEWDDFEPFWQSEDGGFTEEAPPTHWMPLPAPPDTQRTDPPTTCRWWRDEYGNWCCACSDTMPDFTPWTSADPNGAHCPKCGKAMTTKVHDKP